jgi:hypothetical protein
MKYDVSWVMQSYLGEYKGSRSDADKKFIRAVKSFLAIDDPRTQLVIASDGCQITHDLYYKHFKKYENISYVYVDKSTPKMYEKIEGQSDATQYYRGVPRQAARALVEGYLTAYIDSDDFLMPNAAQIIKQWWNHMTKNNPGVDYKWAAMTNWIENIAFKEYVEKSNDELIFKPINEPFKIKGLKSKWQKWSMKEPTKHVQSTTWATVHRSDCVTKWADHMSDPTRGGISEDTIFARSIRKEGKGFLINDGFYVRCHYSNIWDY